VREKKESKVGRKQVPSLPKKPKNKYRCSRKRKPKNRVIPVEETEEEKENRGASVGLNRPSCPWGEISNYCPLPKGEKKTKLVAGTG